MRKRYKLLIIVFISFLVFIISYFVFYQEENIYVAVKYKNKNYSYSDYLKNNYKYYEFTQNYLEVSDIIKIIDDNNYYF